MGNRKECNQIYGSKLFQEYKNRLIGGQHRGQKITNSLVWNGFFARYSYQDGRKVCKPVVLKDFYNQTFDSSHCINLNQRTGWKMKSRDIMEHLLADDSEIERMIAYVNRCPCIGGLRIGLFCLDIDNHNCLSKKFIKRCRKLIESVFQGSQIYWEPSTTGHGLHGYILISWPQYTSNQAIRDDIKELQDLVGQITCHIPTNCNEIRGMPHRIQKRRIVDSEYGEWAKMPRPRTSSHMSQFLSTLNHHSSCSGVLSQAKKHQSANPQPAAAVASQNRQKSPKNGAAACCPSTPLTITGNVLGCIMHPDTKKRVLDYSSRYIRAYYRLNQSLPDLVELEDSYEAAGMAIGNSDDYCLKKTYAHLIKTFDEDKSGLAVESFIEGAKKTVNSCIRDNGLIADLSHDRDRRRRVYKNKGRKSSTISRLVKLKEREIAQVLACMQYQLEGRPNREGTFGKDQCKTLMSKIFGTKNNEDGKKFKAIMRWLRRNGLIKLIKYQVISFDKTGECRTYRLVE